MYIVVVVGGVDKWITSKNRVNTRFFGKIACG